MKILNKSNKDAVVADFMLDNELYAPSVHASYYSAFLYVKYVLNHYCAFSYSEQEPKEGKLSHDTLLNKLKTAFPDSTDKLIIDSKRSYFRNHTHLRKKRKEADYTPDAIEKLDAQKTISSTKEFKDAINNLLNLN